MQRSLELSSWEFKVMECSRKMLYGINFGRSGAGKGTYWHFFSRPKESRNDSNLEYEFSINNHTGETRADGEFGRNVQNRILKKIA